MGDVRSTLQSTLGDAYQVERELGGGGMSRVFVATETSLGRRVVVKVLPPELAAGVSIDRFRREIALAASMQHPHIVPLLAAGASAEPLWFTMPYIEGQSLRARLARGGELPVGEAIRILREVADALAYAHRHGVVHRDIKPENVLLSEGHAMVMDFGVAKAIAESTGRALPMTDAGVALGTPNYMSPEQASADPHVDHRADIYAFGVLAFELLTGQPPFTGGTAAQVVRAHLMETAPSLMSQREGVPPILSDLVARCLAKRPADRPQQADELLTALDTMATPTGAMPYISGAGVPIVPPRSWRRVGISAGIVVAVGLVGAGLYLKFGSAPKRPRVVVAPFTNATGDKAFDELGTIIASWAQDAFTRSATLDVADFRALTLNTENSKAVAIGSGATGLRAFAEAAGATRVLTGSIFRLGDSLEFRATIVDPKVGIVVTTVAPVRALGTSPMSGVELLAQRAAGALAASEESGTTKAAFVGAAHLPTLEAYREFNAGVEAYSTSDWEGAVPHFRAAIAADSEFLSAQLWLFQSYANLRTTPKRTMGTDSLVVLFTGLDKRRSELSPLDQAVVGMWLAATSIPRQWDRWIDGLRRAASLWPDRYATNLVQTLNYAGRPREALDVAKTVDPSKGFLRGWATHFQTLVTSHLLLGDYKGALRTAEEGETRFPGQTLTVCYHAIALGVLGKVHEADSILNFVVAGTRPIPTFTEQGCHDRYTSYVASLRPGPEGRNLVQSQVKYLESSAGLLPNGKVNRGAIWYWVTLLGDTVRSLAMADSLAREQPGNRFGPLRIAIAHAFAGRRAEAVKAEDAGLAIPTPSRDNGGTEFWRAVIATGLGDKEKAVRLLRDSMRLGVNATDIYLWGPVFSSLHGYPPFEALIVR